MAFNEKSSSVLGRGESMHRVLRFWSSGFAGFNQLTINLRALKGSFLKMLKENNFNSFTVLDERLEDEKETWLKYSFWGEQKSSFVDIQNRFHMSRVFPFVS